MTTLSAQEKEQRNQAFSAAAAAPPLRPEEAVQEGEDTVTMVFPQAVRLTANDGRVVDFKPGVQEVPESLADHSYLRLNGVKKHNGKGGWRGKLKPQKTQDEKPVMTQHHVEFLKANGVEVADVNDAQRQFDALSPDEQKEFMEEADKFSAFHNTQANIQRRLQDHESGAKEGADKPEGQAGPDAPDPASLDKLVEEGTVVSQTPIHPTSPQQESVGRQTPDGGLRAEEDESKRGQQPQPGQGPRRDLEFEKAHPGSFNPGMETPKPRQGQQPSTGQISTAEPGKPAQQGGKQTPAQNPGAPKTPAASKSPETNKGK
jgi:hypothetical protein